MSIQSITVEMPSGLFSRIKRRAVEAHRSVEVELLETVATAVPLEEELPDDLAAELIQLAMADNATLWAMVHSRFPEERSAQVEALHLRRQASGLSPVEAQQAAAITQEMEKFMFLRAQAMALLVQRGQNLSTLAQA
jgi:plasmid stability protein